MVRHIVFDKENERNENAGVVISRTGKSIRIFFKPNEAGKKAKEMWEKLHEVK